MTKRYLSAVAVVLAAALAAGASAAPNPRAKLVGSAPSWATAANFKSAASDSQSVGFRVYLGWRNAAAAEALARSVSDPTSASYGKYLTPGQFRQQFAPTQAQVTDVQNWLKSQGFAVDYTPTNNHYVVAEGTVAQAEAAFGVQMNLYAVDGTTLASPNADLSIPSSLAATVEGVIGLDDSANLVHTNTTADPNGNPSFGFKNAPPCSTYWGEKLATTLPSFGGVTRPYAPCGYTPSQMQGAYGIAGAIAAGNDGSGQTVAIVDAYASPTIVQDADRYSRDNGLPRITNQNFTQVTAPGTYNHPESQAQDPEGWYGEETLDVEAVHSMAPGAKIVFVGAPNNYRDLDAALNHVVDRGLARIVTNSYGFATELLPTGYVKPVNDTLIQAAAEGIGVYFSSGDNGDESTNFGFATTDWPVSSPWVTAVGGTSLAVGAANNYLFETGWGTDRYLLSSNRTSWTEAGYRGGAGGGTSRIFAQPWYQAGVVPASIATRWSSAPGRAVPDVALDADPNTGFLVGQTQTWLDGTTHYDTYRLGGTSLASPLMAGLMALADQRAGQPHGFANPLLYASFGTAAFHDVVDPASQVAVVRVDYVNQQNPTDGLITSVRTMNFTQSLHTRPGYDDVTGVGTPNGDAFLNALK